MSNNIETQALLMEITKQQYLYDTQRAITAFNRCSNKCLQTQNIERTDFTFEEQNCMQYCTQNYVDTTLLVANEILTAQGTDLENF